MMKIKLGPALKVYNSILVFRTSQDLAGEDAVSSQEAMGGMLYLRDHGHRRALFFQQEPQPQELDFSVSVAKPKYERDLVKRPWLLRVEDLMADPVPAMPKPPGPAGP